LQTWGLTEGLRTICILLCPCYPMAQLPLWRHISQVVGHQPKLIIAIWWIVAHLVAVYLDTFCVQAASN
jgi:hypothetical protein